MRKTGIITDIEYDIDTNEIKTIDVAIIDPQTNQPKIIIITSYEKEIKVSPNQFEDSNYDLFDPVEYLPDESKIRKLISPAPTETAVGHNILNSILNDNNFPGVKDIRVRFEETYYRLGDELMKMPDVSRQRQR